MRARKLFIPLVISIGVIAGVASGAGFPSRVPAEKEAANEGENKEALRPDADLKKTDLYGDSLPAGAVARLGTVRLRLAGSYGCFAFTPGGKTLISADDTSKVTIWDVATGNAVSTLSVDESSERIMCLSPDGKILALGGQQIISVWDLESRKLVHNLNSGSVSSLTFSPDGKTLVSGGAEFDSTIRVWDVATGKERRRMKWHKHQVVHLLVCLDNRTLVSGSSMGGKVHLADLETGKELRTISSQPWVDLSGIFLMPDGKSLLICGLRQEKNRAESIVEWYELATGKKTRAEKVPDDHLLSGAVLTADGKTLVTSESGRIIRVWDLGAWKELRRWKSRATVRQLSPDGKTVAGIPCIGALGITFSNASAILLWDIVTGKELHSFEGHLAAVTSLAFAPDGKALAASSFLDVPRLWDLAKAKELKVFTDPMNAFVEIQGVCFMPDGKGILSWTDDSRVRLWDPATAKELRKFSLRGKYEHVLNLAVTPDGKLLGCCSIGHDGDSRKQKLTVQILDLTTGKEQFFSRVDWDERVFTRPVISPDCKALATQAGADLVLRQLATGKEVRLFKCPDRFEATFVFSPDSRTVAVRSSTPSPKGIEPDKVRSFDALTGKEKGAVSGKDWPGPLAYSVNGKMLAVGAEDHIQLWETANAKARWRSPQLNARVSSLAFSPDSKMLASGLSDGSILIWDITRAPGK